MYFPSSRRWDLAIHFVGCYLDDGLIVGPPRIAGADGEVRVGSAFVDTRAALTHAGARATQIEVLIGRGVAVVA